MNNYCLRYHHNEQRSRRKTASAITCLMLPLLLAASLLAGCSSSKKNAGNSTSGAIPPEIAQQSPQQRYAALCDGYADWQDVSMPVRVRLNSPKSVSFPARAVMRHNEWITLSVRMLGFEVASVWIDNDSVHAIDRYHKMYLSESISRLLAGTDISIGNIQDLLLGRGCLPGQAGGTFTLPLEKSLTLTDGADGLMIFPAVQPQDFEYGYILSPTANNILAASVTTGNGVHAAVMTYSEFTDTPQGHFARSADINIIKGKSISASLEWNLGAAKWNSAEKRQWKTPAGYKRIPADQLLKSISSL